MEIHPDFLNLLEEVSVADSMRKTGSYAPMAASLGAEGIVSGGLFTSPQPSEDSAVDDAIGALIADARDGFQAGRFIAAIIIFHGDQDAGGVMHIAHRPEDATSFVAWLLHSDGDTLQAFIPYGGEPVFSPLPTAR